MDAHMREGTYYNFRTQKKESNPPGDYGDILPQDPITQNLYQMFLSRGNDPFPSAFEVLKICIAGNLYRKTES
jgi:hypothetical protein